MKCIALKCLVGLHLRPSCPTCLLTRHVFQADAINRAHRDAQLAACAVRLNHGVHHLGAAKNSIGRAHRQAQRAANTPGFVNHRHAARAFPAVGGVQAQGGLAGYSCQPGNALSAAGWALVDGRRTFGNRLGIRAAIGVAAAGALGLRQCRMDAASQQLNVRVGHPAIVSAYLLRAALTGARLAAGFATAFTAGFTAAFTAGLTTRLMAGFVVLAIATFLGADCARID